MPIGRCCQLQRNTATFVLFPRRICHENSRRSIYSAYLYRVIGNKSNNRNDGYNSLMIHERRSPWWRGKSRSSLALSTLSSSASYSTGGASSSSLPPSSLEAPVCDANGTKVGSEVGGGGGLLRLLTVEQQEILAEQRALVVEARKLAQYVGVPSSKESSSKSSSNLLPDASFCVVVIGEFNSGKSTLINALLGNSQLLPMGSLPTTERLTVLTRSTASTAASDTTNTSIGEDELFGSSSLLRDPESGTPHEPSLSSNNDLNHNISNRSENVEYIQVGNAPLLHDLTLVDTPGTNALFRHTHETTQILPHADWIVFVTSADRPLPESEQNLLKTIAQYQKSIIIVINKIDILNASGGDHGAAEKQRVVEYVHKHASQILFPSNNNQKDSSPSDDEQQEQPKLVVLGVSARDALAAKVLQSQAGVWKRSNFAQLEEFLVQTLTTQTKIQSKLASPLGVAVKYMNECLQVLQVEQQELEIDIVTLKLLQVHIDDWRNDLERDLKLARQDMIRVLEHQGDRCHVLLRRLSWIEFIETMLLDRHQLQNEWDRTQEIVFRSHDHDDDYDRRDDNISATRIVLESKIRETADAIALRGRAQGQAVIEFLGKRPSVRQQPLSLVGSVTSASKFEETRLSLTQEMSQAVREAIPGKRDEDHEIRILLNQLQSAAQLTVGAWSVTAVSALAAATLQLVEPAIAGLGAACGLMAVTGATCWSIQQQAARTYQQIWNNRSQRLGSALERIASEEVERMERRVHEGVTPYRQLIESEGTRIRNLSEKCRSVIQRTGELRSRIDSLPRSSSS